MRNQPGHRSGPYFCLSMYALPISRPPAQTPYGKGTARHQSKLGSASLPFQAAGGSGYKTGYQPDKAPGRMVGSTRPHPGQAPMALSSPPSACMSNTPHLQEQTPQAFSQPHWSRLSAPVPKVLRLASYPPSCRQA